MDKIRFEVIHLQDSVEFLSEIDEKVRDKITFNISKAQSRLDPRLFKKIDSILWEFRTEYGGTQYRLLAFWHRRNEKLALVITTHGFVKKTDKVPAKEIERAHELRKQFLNNEEETDR